MRQVKVYYSDKTLSTRGERFETRAMEPDRAKEVADALACMGCSDFEFVPVRGLRPEDIRKAA